MWPYTGKIEYFPHFSVDNFSGLQNLSSQLFFLSHGHTDHMRGLDSPEFYRRLTELVELDGMGQSTPRLICSPITKQILYNHPRYSHISPYFRALSLNTPHLIKTSNFESSKKEAISVRVTLYPAGHCPGSVMFLFEGPIANVLYTGDFRFGKHFLDLPINSKLSKKELRTQLQIDVAYVDTTFGSPDAAHIPSREDSCQTLVNLVQEWLREKPNTGCKKYVRINLLYDLGYEPLYHSLFESTGMQVHVSDYQSELYQDTNVAQYLTLDPTVTVIHACREPYNSISNPEPGCEDANSQLNINNFGVKHCIDQDTVSDDENNTLVIQPSVMWWNAADTKSKSTIHKISNFYRLCFSTHPSYGEVVKFMNYIRPRVIYPIAKPMGCSIDRLNRILANILIEAKSSKTSKILTLKNVDSTRRYSNFASTFDNTIEDVKGLKKWHSLPELNGSLNRTTHFLDQLVHSKILPYASIFDETIPTKNKKPRAAPKPIVNWSVPPSPTNSWLSDSSVSSNDFNDNCSKNSINTKRKLNSKNSSTNKLARINDLNDSDETPDHILDLEVNSIPAIT